MAARRSYGSGSLLTNNGTYYGKFRDGTGRQVKRRVGLVRTPHRPDGLTKSQAEARLRDLMRDASASVPQSSTPGRSKRPRTRGCAHLAATGAKASSRPRLQRRHEQVVPADARQPARSTGSRRATSSTSCARCATPGLSDKSIRNYVGALRALFNYATDRRRRWAARNPVADVDLPKAPTYSEIRYLTRDEVWALVGRRGAGRVPRSSTGRCT